MRNYWFTVRAFNRSTWLYLVCWALATFTYFGLIGVLQNLYLLRLDFDAKSIGLMAGAGQLFWAIAALPSAVVSRRLGPKRAMLLAFATIGATHVMFMLVELIPASMRLAWTMFWNAANGCGISLLLVASIPYLASATSESERNHAFAMQSALISLSAFAGGLFAGALPGWVAQATGSTLNQPASYRLGLWLVPVFYAANVLIFSRARHVDLVEQHETHQPASRAPVRTLTLFGFIIILFSVSDGAVGAFLNVFLDQQLGVPPAQIGALIGLSALLPVLAALVTAPLMKRFDSGATFDLGALGVSISTLFLALATTFLFAALARSINTVMGQIAGVSRSLFSQDIVEARWRTLSSAVTTIGMGVGLAVAAFAGGFLIQSIGFAGVFFLAGLMTLASGVIAIVYWRKRKAVTSPVPAPQVAESLLFD